MENGKPPNLWPNFCCKITKNWIFCILLSKSFLPISAFKPGLCSVYLVWLLIMQFNCTAKTQNHKTIKMWSKLNSTAFLSILQQIKDRIRAEINLTFKNDKTQPLFYVNCYVIMLLNLFYVLCMADQICKKDCRFIAYLQLCCILRRILQKR